MRLIALWCSCMVFWILLSGEFKPYLLGAGAVCSLFTTWVCHRMRIVDAEGFPIERSPYFFRYNPWLLWQIALSNIDVAKRVWSPKLPIDPEMVEIPYDLRTSIGLVTYANSITLTPGTVTVEVNEEKRTLLIHALTKEGVDDLRKGEMIEKVRQFEKNWSPPAPGSLPPPKSTAETASETAAGTSDERKETP